MELNKITQSKSLTEYLTFLKEHWIIFVAYFIIYSTFNLYVTYYLHGVNILDYVSISELTIRNGGFFFECILVLSFILSLFTVVMTFYIILRKKNNTQESSSQKVNSEDRTAINLAVMALLFIISVTMLAIRYNQLIRIALVIATSLLFIGYILIFAIATITEITARVKNLLTLIVVFSALSIPINYYRVELKIKYGNNISIQFKNEKYLETSNLKVLIRLEEYLILVNTETNDLITINRSEILKETTVKEKPPTK